MVGRQVLGLLIAAVLSTATFTQWAGAPARTDGGAHFADADDRPMVMLGKKIYMSHCASCHGRNLQGQPLWQLNDEYVGRRAPAHDETGHTWQHSDEDLFYMIKFGTFSSAPADAVSFMPAFDTVLGDRETLSVMAFIKARWPNALRISQAMLNPDHAGMPQQASATEWRLLRPPAMCPSDNVPLLPYHWRWECNKHFTAGYGDRPPTRASSSSSSPKIRSMWVSRS
jgi:mono/diheme cytochrome c family protein